MPPPTAIRPIAGLDVASRLDHHGVRDRQGRVGERIDGLRTFVRDTKAPFI